MHVCKSFDIVVIQLRYLCFSAGRALRKVDELIHLLDIAKMNFRQLGGVLQEDEKEREKEREHSR